MEDPTPPPGLEAYAGRLTTHVSLHSSKPWLPHTPPKEYTNAFIVQPDANRILLGYKKRGIGAGLFNGFGGKVEPDETPLRAANRELREEAGIDAPLEPVGTLVFVSAESPCSYHIHIYRAQTFSGTIVETEEMIPRWFAIASDADGLEGIPYGKMWENDEHWLPLLIANRPFAARVDFHGRAYIALVS